MLTLEGSRVVARVHMVRKPNVIKGARKTTLASREYGRLTLVRTCHSMVPKPG